MLVDVNELPVAEKSTSPGPKPIPSAFPLNVLFVTVKPSTFSVDPMPAVLLRIRLPETFASCTQAAVAPPASEIPVTQFSMMLFVTLTGPGTALVLPNRSPRESAVFEPVTLKPVIVTLVAELPLTTTPPEMVASALRVPVPATAALGPDSVKLLSIETVSANVPANTITMSPADAAVTADWIVVYALPTVLPTTSTLLSANWKRSTLVTVSTLEPPLVRVTTTFAPLKASV